MRLSGVTTLYESAPYVDEFYRRLRTEVEKITSDFEIVFVNALDLALDFQKEEMRIRVIDLSRNFDHHKAIMTGPSRDLSRLCN
jgi:putative glycosyltransferase